jgi:hypothetical protein
LTFVNDNSYYSTRNAFSMSLTFHLVVLEQVKSKS